jgi:hypothetical protein
MSFRNAVFAGGGSRCFWQLGFWEGAIQSGLDLRSSVLMSGAPKWLSRAASAMIGASIYGLEQILSNPLHPKWPKRAGFRPIVGRAKDAGP